MAGDIKSLLEIQKRLYLEDKKRLGLLIKDSKEECGNYDHDEQHQEDDDKQSQSQQDKENQPPVINNIIADLRERQPDSNKKLPLIQELDLNSTNKNNNNEGSIEESKHQAFNAEYPFRSDDPGKCKKMLRYGEYSPNNPQLRVVAAPYLGLGEYEQRRNLFLQKQRADYLDHLSKRDANLLVKKNIRDNSQSELQNNVVIANNKAVQTDLQNIHYPLVQYESESRRLIQGDELSPYYSNSVGHPNISSNKRNLASSSYRLDQKLTSAQNALLMNNKVSDMDKPKSILSNRRTGSPRDIERHTSYGSSFLDGFSYQDRAEELERERIKRDKYQRELRLQIEEKRHLQAMREEQERREQELENRRLEQQLLRMQEEQAAIDGEQRWGQQQAARRHSEDLLRRKHELQSRGGAFRKHTDSDSGVLSLRNTNVASKALSSHYSPPVSRRNFYSYTMPSSSTSVFGGCYNPNRYDASYYRKDALNRMDSLHTNYDSSSSRFNNHNNIAFGRYDSLSRIDSSLNRQDNTLSRIESLNIQDSLSHVQRRHSATQQDLSMLRRSPKLQRRSSSSRFDDTLPIPVLKAHSPVAKELKNSVPFNSSRHSSDAVRKLEDKWQIPAVQKNIINHGDPLRDGQGRSILTQLGAIRMQLQQEQLRMDETLRKRDFTQSKAVDFH